MMNISDVNKRKVYRDKYSGGLVEIERVDNYNIRIYYFNGFNQVLNDCVLEYYYEEVEDLDSNSAIKMLYLSIKHYVDSCGGLEDHHAILDIMDMIKCSRPFAELLVKKLIEDKVVINTGELK